MPNLKIKKISFGVDDSVFADFASVIVEYESVPMWQERREKYLREVERSEPPNETLRDAARICVDKK